MTTLDAATLAHVARLARLPLDDAEAARFGRELPEILAAFDALPDADGAGDPDADAAAPPRADEAARAAPEVRERILAAFPRRDGDLARVPRGL